MKKILERTKTNGRTVMSDTAKRKQVAEASGTSNEHYKTLFESMLQGAFFQGADGRLLDVNPMALQIFGLTRREFLNRTSHSSAWNVIREDGSSLSAEEHPSMVALKTGGPVKDKLVGILNHQTNDYRWVIVNAIPQFRTGESTPYQVSVTMHDITERRQIDKELLLFRETVQNSSDAIGMSTPEGVHYYQNRAFDDLFGDIGPDPSARIYVVEKVGREVFATIMSGKRWLGEVDMKAKDGSVLNILLRAYPNKDSSGRIIGLVGIHTDITQRRLAEEALKQSEASYRHLTEAAPDAIFTANGQGRIISWNHGAEKIYGFKPEEIIGKDCALIMPENQRKQHTDIFALLIKAGKPMTSDTPFQGLGRRLDGSTFETEQTFNLHWSGNEPFFTIIARDITERKQLEKKLHESEELFRSSFENAPIGIGIYNNKGVLLQINTACEQCFGRSKEDLMQHRLSLFIHPDDKKNTIEAINKIMSAQETHGLPKVLENRYYAPDGHTIYTRQYFQGVFNAEGKPFFIIILTDDITAAKKLTLMNDAIVHKLKDVHLQLNEFTNLLANDKNYISTKTLSDYGLTAMENRIASMIVHGAANTSIAKKLRISENTVKHHITSIYSKMNVKNRIGFINTIRINRIII